MTCPMRLKGLLLLQDYVKELAKLLLAHGDDPSSDGYRQLEDYVLQAVSPSLACKAYPRTSPMLLILMKRSFIQSA